MAIDFSATKSKFTPAEVTDLGETKAVCLSDYDIDGFCISNGMDRASLIRQLGAAVSVDGDKVTGDQTARVLGGIMFGD